MIKIFQLLSCTSVSAVVFYRKYEVFIVKVFCLKEEEISTALSRMIRSVRAIIASHPLALNALALFLLGKARHFFRCAFLLALCQCLIYIGKSESCCEDSNLHLVTKCRIVSYTPLQFKIGELLHEVVNLSHLIHHQTLVVSIICMSNREEYLLGVENIVIIEQWRVEGIFYSALDTSVTLTIAC